MIKLTRFDGREILVNEDFFEIIEEAPDTVITLQNGHRLIVKESINTILMKARQFQKLKHRPTN